MSDQATAIAVTDTASQMLRVWRVAARATSATTSTNGVIWWLVTMTADVASAMAPAQRAVWRSWAMPRASEPAAGALRKWCRTMPMVTR